MSTSSGGNYSSSNSSSSDISSTSDYTFYNSEGEVSKPKTPNKESTVKNRKNPGFFRFWMISSSILLLWFVPVTFIYSFFFIKQDNNQLGNRSSPQQQQPQVREVSSRQSLQQAWATIDRNEQPGDPSSKENLVHKLNYSQYFHRTIFLFSPKPGELKEKEHSNKSLLHRGCSLPPWRWQTSN